MSRSPYGDPRYPTPPPPGAPGPYPPPGGPYQPPTYAPPPYPPGSYAPEGYPPGAYPPGASPPGGYPPGAPPPPAEAAPPPAATPTPPAAAPPSTGRGRRSERDRGGVVAGIVVVGIGLFLLAAQVVPDIGQWIPLAIGLVFLAAFVSRREYGFLIPGSILAGIGVGVVLANVLEGSLAGPAVVLSLAGGFVAIWVVSSITGIGPVSRSADGTEAPSATWWPLIPGGILGLIGAVLLADADAGGILRWWPVAIVALGIVILARALLERRSRS